MELYKKVKKRIKDIERSLVPLILAPFTFFIFGPLEMVVQNSMRLRFSWRDVLPIQIVTFCICFLLFCILGILLHEKSRKYYIALIFGLGVVIYSQGNLMPIDYGILDGQQIAWGEYIPWAIINTAIWVVLIAVPVVIAHYRNDILKRARTHFNRNNVRVLQLLPATLSIRLQIAAILRNIEKSPVRGVRVNHNAAREWASFWLVLYVVN